LNRPDRRKVLGWLGAGCVAGLHAAAFAESYPSRPVQLIVGYPPGSATDFIARLVGQKMGQSLGQSFVVENRPGASGMVAAASVVRATPDGYTIVATVPASTTAARAIFGSKLQYAPDVDLVPIGLVGVSPLVLITTPNSGIRSGKDLLAAARSTPGGLSIGSYGIGSPAHFAIETLKVESKVPLVHIPHNGPAAMQTALLAGTIPVAVDSITSALPQIEAAKFVPLAVTAARRSSMLTSVPTAAEAGLGPIEAAGWVGFHAPKDTPFAIVGTLNAEMNRALAQVDVRQQLGTRMEIIGGTPESFKAFLAAETERLNRITSEAKLTFN
jgi:tripartite-type tricarboxylate transporter receptor subunit TctC